MRLTDHTDYSIRTLMYLNQIYINEEKRLVTLSELSSRLGISKNNLIKVSNQLAKLNFIETTRGRTGGLLIKKETGKTSLKEIVTKTEETFYLAECFPQKKCACTFFPTCSLRKTLFEALQAFLDTLAEKTLDDVTPKKRLAFT